MNARVRGDITARRDGERRESSKRRTAKKLNQLLPRQMSERKKEGERKHMYGNKICAKEK